MVRRLISDCWRWITLFLLMLFLLTAVVGTVGSLNAQLSDSGHPPTTLASGGWQDPTGG